MKKFFIVYITFLILIVVFAFYMGGRPGMTFYHFEDSGVVCKKWNTEWRMSYNHDQCWQLEKVK